MVVGGRAGGGPGPCDAPVTVPRKGATLKEGNAASILRQASTGEDELLPPALTWPWPQPWLRLREALWAHARAGEHDALSSGRILEQLPLRYFDVRKNGHRISG